MKVRPVLAQRGHLAVRSPWPLGDDEPVGMAYWPIFDLKLETPRLLLRPATEADLPVLAGLVPTDAEPDPRLPHHPAIDDPRLRRGIALFQSYWDSFATWNPSHWRIGFVVRQGDEIVGMQE